MSDWRVHAGIVSSTTSGEVLPRLSGFLSGRVNPRCWGEPRRDYVSCSHSRLEVPLASTTGAKYLASTTEETFGRRTSGGRRLSRGEPSCGYGLWRQRLTPLTRPRRSDCAWSHDFKPTAYGRSCSRKRTILFTVGCPQDPKKEKKKKCATPDRSTSCWRVEILRV